MSVNLNMLISVSFMGVNSLFVHYVIVQETLVAMNHILRALLEVKLIAVCREDSGGVEKSISALY